MILEWSYYMPLRQGYLTHTIQKFEVGKIFYVFERSLLYSTRLHFFDQQYSKYWKILVQFKT